MDPTPGKYRKMLDNLPDAYAYHQIVTDSDGNPVDFIILDVNRAFERMTGLVKEQIIGKKGKEMHPKLEISEFDWVGIYSQAALTGETVCFEKYFKRAGRWHNITAYSDEPGYLMVIFRDITEQKRAEKQLKTLTDEYEKVVLSTQNDIFLDESMQVSQEHYRLLVDNANEAIIISQDGMHKFVNPMAVQMFGYSEQELLSKPITAFFHPEDRDMVEERHYRRLKGENVTQRYTFRIVRKNGLVRWVETNNVLVEWKGKPAALVFLMDISERKKAEEALKRSEKKFRDLVEQTPDWVWEVDDKTRVFSYVSPGAKKMTGYEVEEIMGRSPFDFVVPEEREKTRQAFVSAVKKLEPLSFFQYSMIHKNGHSIAIETNGVPVFDEDGHLQAYRGINRDITERKYLEERLKYLSLHDQLTGLYNRTFFDEEMERLESSRAYPLTIICADLDDLKLVNDTMGHESGDELLRICARVLQKTLRRSDILARIGGDEFAAILPKTDSQTGEKIVARIRSQLEQYGLAQQCQFPLSISMGIATAEKQGKTLKETLKEADDLMYQDKLHRGAGGRSRIIQSLRNKYKV